MRIVYKTHTEYTAKEFGRMNAVLQKRNPKVRKVEYILAAVFAVVLLAFLYQRWFVAAAVCAVITKYLKVLHRLAYRQAFQ